ncbi:MAG: hypothetical protein R3C09_27685 [Pirellulaceae bacterium]
MPDGKSGRFRANAELGISNCAAGIDGLAPKRRSDRGQAQRQPGNSASDRLKREGPHRAICHQPNSPQ